MVLLVSLEESHQVWQLEGELVHSKLELERRQLDESLLFGVVLLLVVLGQHAGDHGEKGQDEDDLRARFVWRSGFLGTIWAKWATFRLLVGFLPLPPLSLSLLPPVAITCCCRSLSLSPLVSPLEAARWTNASRLTCLFILS